MSALVGKDVKIILSLPDGREFHLDEGIVTNVAMSTRMEGLSTFDVTIDSPKPLRQAQHSTVQIEGFLTGNLGNLFDFVPDEKKLKKSGMVAGEHYCDACGSDWRPDSRGNCGACGIDKRRGKRKDNE